MDDLLLTFVRDNMVSISLGLGILKVLAKATPWAVDDEIVQLFIGWMKR